MTTAKRKISAEKITLVPLTDLHERADNPIKMRDDVTMTGSPGARRRFPG